MLFRSTSGSLPANGAEVTLAVRPEKMAVVPSPESTANSLSARITTVIYAGQALSYLLVSPAGIHLKLFAQNKDGRVLSEGEVVTLAWSPEHTIAVAE